MTWDLVFSEIKEIKSYLNKKRTKYIIERLYDFTEGYPTPALYMEFMSKMSKEDIISPTILARMGRYVTQNRTLNDMFVLPEFVGGYVIFDKYIDRKSAWKALERVGNKSVQAYLALMVSGCKYYRVAIKTRVSEYDRQTGIVSGETRVTPMAKKYLDAQYERAIAAGLGPDDPLFYMWKEGYPMRRITKKDVRFANRQVIAETGVDLFGYGLLAYRLKFYESGQPIRIFRESQSDKSKRNS